MGCNVLYLAAVLAGLAVFGTAIEIDGGLGLLGSGSDRDSSSSDDPSETGAYLEIEVGSTKGSSEGSPTVVARVWTGKSRLVANGSRRPTVFEEWTRGHNTTDDIETNNIPSDKNKPQVLRKLIPNYDFQVVPVVTGKTPVSAVKGVHQLIPNYDFPVVPVVTGKTPVSAVKSTYHHSWQPGGGGVGVRGPPVYLERPTLPCGRQPLPPHMGAGRPRQPVGWSWRAWRPVEDGRGRGRGEPRPRFEVDDKLGPLSEEEEGDGIDGKLGGQVEGETLS